MGTCGPGRTPFLVVGIIIIQEIQRGTWCKMRRRFAGDDFWSLRTIGKVALAPDGRTVAFEVHSSNKGENDTRSAIYLLALDEHGLPLGEPSQLTSGIKHDTSPVWASDSNRLLFLSDREENFQLWLIDINGGEARRLTNMLHGVAEAAWSPDGNWIAFTALSSPQDELDLLLGRKTLNEQAKKRYEEDELYRPRTVTSIWHKVDGRGVVRTYSQVFVMPAPRTRYELPNPGAIRRLTSTALDHTQPAWSPDSKEVSFLCNRNNNRDRSFVQDLWTIHLETTEARCLTDGNLEIDSYSWSPDGNAVLLVAAKDQIKYGPSLKRLYLVTHHGDTGDRTLLLCPDLEYDATVLAGSNIGEPGPYRVQWSTDGQQVYFLVTERGCVNVYRLDIVWRTLIKLTSGLVVTRFLAFLPQRQALLLLQERPDHPFEFLLLPIEEHDAGEGIWLSHFYDSWLDEFEWAETEHLQYIGADGEMVDGWLMYPVGAREGIRYPLMVMIHGGPHWSYGIGMDARKQFLAAQGYALFYCNPHGSTGYGEGFMRSTLGDWGRRDYQDLMLGIDQCIERGVADPERLVVTGYSYGGYLTMYMIGQTGRFKAAAPMAGISNLSSFVGTSDLGFWLVMESLGHPWDSERIEVLSSTLPYHLCRSCHNTHHPGPRRERSPLSPGTVRAVLYGLENDWQYTR